VGSTEPIDLPAHRNLVRAFFPPEVAIRILRLERNDPPCVAFHRQQLLFLMKEAFQYASDDPTLEMTNRQLGEVLLIANDHMHFQTDMGGPDTLTKFVGIASTFLQLKETVAANPIHKVLRSYQMTKAAAQASAAPPHFDLSELFKQATGLELADFYALVFAAVSRFSKFDPANPSTYRLDKRWFSSTKASSETIEAFFKLIAATPSEFADRLGGNAGPNDFTAFRDKPMLRASSDLDLIDFWMLMEKFGSGPFWAALSAIDSSKRDAFHPF
jgi:hypothetical protein